jgi:hypothetical protein
MFSFTARRKNPPTSPIMLISIPSLPPVFSNRRRRTMHFKSLLHVRDHSKAKGRAHHLLEYIAQHVNMHTGEAFGPSVERLAERLDVTPQWVRQLRARLVAEGELIFKQSNGRHPNVYIIPYERCPACQGLNPKVELPVDPIPDDVNPKVEDLQPESREASTRNSDPSNPKLAEYLKAVLARIESRKDSLKEEKEKKEGPTRKSREEWLDKPERRSPFWCEVHGFCHSERLSDHHPECVRER